MSDRISYGRLRELVEYDPDTGLFTRLQARTSNRVGEQPTGKDLDGYVRFRLDGKPYFAHVLAWFYMTGEWPSHQIDHENRIPHDNQWSNLRLATYSENAQNKSNPLSRTSSGYLGVSWHKRQFRWIATIWINGKSHHLGYHATRYQAHQAYLAAKRELHTFWSEQT